MWTWNSHSPSLHLWGETEIQLFGVERTPKTAVLPFYNQLPGQLLLPASFARPCPFCSLYDFVLKNLISFELLFDYMGFLASWLCYISLSYSSHSLYIFQESFAFLVCSPAFKCYYSFTFIVVVYYLSLQIEFEEAVKLYLVSHLG